MVMQSDRRNIGQVVEYTENNEQCSCLLCICALIFVLIGFLANSSFSENHLLLFVRFLGKIDLTVSTI